VMLLLKFSYESAFFIASTESHFPLSVT